MIDFLTDPKTLAIASIVVAAASEIIGMNPKWKSNSIVHIILVIAQRLVGQKKEKA
ncbi:MAG: hypothetical protein HN597_03545 [Desulfobacula sp.]|jgi:hypothetical protein|nr:hypothetical protein [Desulfobacula sp.]